MEKYDAVIIGAGPYGLSVGAHLRQIKGLDLRVFGEPMSFWERHMPEGMLLRSPRVASYIHDGDGRLTLDTFETETGAQEPVKMPPTIIEDFIAQDFSRKVRLCHFIKYGHWFHKEAGVAADRRKVTRVEAASGGYRLEIEDGTTLQARCVVVAGGIQPFAAKPKMFDLLPAPLVLHTSEFRNLGMFRGKEVLVVGGGQSALETAALLYEAGAHVEVSVRHRVRWFGMRSHWWHQRPQSLILYGRADVGPAGISMLVQYPRVFRRLPRRLQDRFGPRAIVPGASSWVMARTRHVPIHENHAVVQAGVTGGRVRVQYGDGTDRLFDHVVLGTGYRVNITLYPFLSQTLRERIAVVDGYPRLDSRFETTSPGLYFVGAPAAWSFGPLMRFVDGTRFTAGVLAREFRRVTQPCGQICVPGLLQKRASGGFE